MKSDDYNARLQARQNLFKLCAQATDPAKSDLKQSDQFEVELLAGVTNRSLPIEARLYCLRLIGLLGSEQVVADLAALLQAEERLIVDGSRGALLVINTPAAKESILTALRGAQDEAWQLELVNSVAFGSIKGAGGELIDLLDSESVPLRRAAIDALGRLGDSAAVASIWGVYPELNQHDKVLAENALWRIGMPASVAGALYEKAVSEQARAAAFEFWLDTDVSQAQAALRRILEDSDPYGRIPILLAALHSQNDSITALVLDAIQQLDVTSQLVLVYALGRADNLDREALLLSMLENASEMKLKCAIVELLGQYGGDRSYTAVYQAYASNPRQSIFREAIAQLKADSADREALTAVQSGTTKEKNAAIQVLQVRNSAGAVDLLNTLLSDVDQLDSSLVPVLCKALELIGDGASIQLMLEAIIAQSPHMTAIKRSLFRLSQRFGAPHQQWHTYYGPSLKKPLTHASQDALIQVLPALACKESLEYLEQIYAKNDFEYAKSAWGALNRWPADASLAAGFLSLRLINAGHLDGSQRAQATSKLKKLLGIGHGHYNAAQAKLLVAIAQSSLSVDVREQLLAVYKEPKKHFRHKQNRQAAVKLLKPLIATSDIGASIEKLVLAMEK